MRRIAGFMIRRMYRVSCPSCQRVYDTLEAADCNCIGPRRTFQCPSCGECFCNAPREFLDRFWAAAPAELHERRRKRPAGEAAPAATQEHDPSKQVVLFADDDATGRLIAKKVLEEMGYVVLLAKDGQELLDRAREARPDLIITDALMPRGDGREIGRMLKAEFPQTRIVVITSVYKDPRYKHEAYRNFGVDEYLNKPVGPEKLREVVQRLLARATEE